MELIQLKSVGRRAYDWRVMESVDVVGEDGMLKCDAIIKNEIKMIVIYIY